MVRRTSLPREAGLTTIELVAAIVFVSITVVVGVRAIMVTGTVTKQTVSSSQLEQRLHRVAAQISEELLQARVDTLDPVPEQPLGASTLTYERAEIDMTGRIVWSTPRSIELVPATDDPEDGIDNDRDGLVDEHDIWLVRNAGLENEQRSLLTTGVASFLAGESENVIDDNGNELFDERGLSFELRDGVMLIRLTMQARDAEGEVASRTCETAIRMRN